MTPRSRLHRRRPGFTLVELMVSAAICVLIMAILSGIFQISIDTIRHMKSTLDMADQLRSAGEVMKRDLQADHFDRTEGIPNGGLKVSDYHVENGVLPRAGFFRIYSVGNSFDSGGASDDAGLYSTRADASNGHLLHFTSVLPGGTDQNVYTATAVDQNGVSKTYSSRAAEIAYFLEPTLTVVDASVPFAQQIPLSNLIRRQRLVALTAADKANFPPNANNTVNSPSVISVNAGNTVNALADLTNQANRLGAVANPNPKTTAPVTANDTLIAPMASRPGDDILLSNVISFEVKVTWSDTAKFVGGRDFYAPSPPAAGGTVQNSDFPFDIIGGEFDTRNPAPRAIRVKALQIRIRVWDPKFMSARQITIVQDL